jgi:hypothetical protein
MSKEIKMKIKLFFLMAILFTNNAHSMAPDKLRHLRGDAAPLSSQEIAANAVFEQLTAMQEIDYTDCEPASILDSLSALMMHALTTGNATLQDYAQQAIDQFSAAYEAAPGTVMFMSGTACLFAGYCAIECCAKILERCCCPRRHKKQQ